MKKKYCSFLIILIIVFGTISLDQGTKMTIENILLKTPNHSISIASFFNLTLVYNTGISFGILSKIGAKHPLILSSIAIISLTLCILYLYLPNRKKYKSQENKQTLINEIEQEKNQKQQSQQTYIISVSTTETAIAMICSGAIGNLIDRIRIGKVIDFIDIHIMEYHYPAFNVADMAIVLGAIALLFKTRTIKNNQR